MIQAGSMGVPFVSTLGYAGTNILKRRPDDFQIITNPFDPDERIVVAKAINPDVAIFHGLRGDRYGNVSVQPRGEELLLAQASRRVIISVEEIVDEVGPEDPGGSFIPAIHISAVVHAPFGAHPTSAPGFYDADSSLIEEYVEAARTQDSFDAYVESQVREVGSHEEYIQRLGLAPAREAVST